MSEATIREEYLASFCFASEGDPRDELVRLASFAASVESAFLHWEIVYALVEKDRARTAALSQTLWGTKNLRVIVVKDDTNFYRRRAIAVSEAIGDVVVLTAFA